MFSIQEVSDQQRIFKLEDNEVLIGRGPFLGVTDKRVSRNHGTLKLVPGGIEMKSTHLNPCFYARKFESEKWMKLDKNESIVLYEGDVFSLLPKCFVYEVIKTQVTGSEDAGDSGTTEQQHLSILQNPKVENHDDKRSTDGTVDASRQKKRRLPQWMMRNSQSSEASMKPKTSKRKPTASTASTSKRRTAASSSKRKVKIEAIQFESDGSEEDIIAEKSSPIKMSKKDGVSEDMEILKNEDCETSTEMVEVADASVAPTDASVAAVDASVAPADASVTPAETQQNTDASASQGSSEGAQSPRESCGYGSSCYRRNPQHRAEFSHPGDDDYEEVKGEKPECPYGTNCYRKNPLHRKQFKHSRRVAPKRQAKTKTQRKQDDESSSDEYDLDDSFLNDESEVEDVDEDEDWDPAGGSQSQTPARASRRSRDSRKNYAESDSDATTDDSDLEDLVADAKKFSKNVKMWKK